jgi:hypothetical protein
MNDGDCAGAVWLKKTYAWLVGALRQATTRSGFPSPFRSSTSSAYGVDPTVSTTVDERTGVPTAGSVWLKKTTTVPSPSHATTISGLASPFRSATFSAPGEPWPVAKSSFVVNDGELIPADVALRSTEMEAAILLDTTMSGRPSLLTSPSFASHGPEPVAKSLLAAKLSAPPEERLAITETVSAVEFTAVTSSLPSPSTSPTTIPVGPVPVTQSTRPANDGL